MNPLRQDDPRHERAVKAASDETNYMVRAVSYILTAYYAALEKEGVVLAEAYAGDDAGRT